MTTPMRKQYLQIKKQYPDAIVFFRLGDFYETFDDDAKIVAEVCEITLTSRPVTKDQRVPLAGVPWHSVETYLAKLIQAGYKVAICEQVGEVGKGLVDRDVVRVVTPGTLVEADLLDARRNNYLTALIFEGGMRAGLAYADITTGEFAVTELSGEDVARRVTEELARLDPAELIIPDTGGYPGLDLDVMVSPYTPWRFETEAARQTLLDFYGVSTLAGFGCEHKPLAISAAGALVAYLQETQKQALGQLTPLHTYTTDAYMVLDEATRRNLELLQTLRDDRRRGSLLWVLDKTRTPMGGRLLRRRLSQPLLDVERINRRLDRVEAWVDATLSRAALRKALQDVGDIERWANRCVQKIATPRDLAALRESLQMLPALTEIVTSVHPNQHLDTCDEILQLLESALSADPPATLQHGGVIRSEYNEELHRIRTAAQDARSYIAGLEKQERERTGIKNLKVGYNKVFGYYLEVTHANTAQVPDDYIRKQTLVNAERYITPELKEYESLTLSAQERLLDLETQLYRGLVNDIASVASRLLSVASIIAELDVHSALAEVAVDNRYTRPQLAADLLVDIKRGRHPVVELTQISEPFTPNNTFLTPDQRIVILTGPNMGGKCVRGDTLLLTEAGMRSIASLSLDSREQEGFSPLEIDLDGPKGPVRSSHHYVGGYQDTIWVQTAAGFELEGTPEHRIWVQDDDGGQGWRRLDTLKPGDRVAIRYGGNVWGRDTALPLEPQKGHDPHGSDLHFPTVLSQDLSYLLGLLVGAGDLKARSHLLLRSQKRWLLEAMQRLLARNFGPINVTVQTDHAMEVESPEIRHYLATLGLEYWSQGEKSIPACIAGAPRPHCLAFLRGLLHACAYQDEDEETLRLNIISPMLVRQMRLMLLNLGVLTVTQVQVDQADFQAQLLIDPNYARKLRQAFTTNHIAAIPELETAGGMPMAGSLQWRDDNTLIFSEHYLEEGQEAGIFFDSVRDLRRGQAEVFDLSIPGVHAFNAEGFVSHNSTWLRQTALITLMAQIGSFVPADSAHIGLVDRIFTRIGAQDELHSGQSTFMVEMVETANILNHATERSLILLDELGRGTSTYDGMAIAWAVIEFLHSHPRLRARTLFATHYHELTALAERLPQVTNEHVAVAEQGDDVVFLHEIRPGGADRSYGIHVAQLAGLPRQVISRATEIMQLLERSSGRGEDLELDAGTMQLQLFQEGPDPIRAEIEKVDVNSMTPIDALNFLFGLQQKAKRK